MKWTVDGENQGAVGFKEGKACAKVILGMVAQGDASLQAAASAGGLRQYGQSGWFGETGRKMANH